MALFEVQLAVALRAFLAHGRDGNRGIPTYDCPVGARGQFDKVVASLAASIVLLAGLGVASAIRESAQRSPQSDGTREVAEVEGSTTSTSAPLPAAEKSLEPSIAGPASPALGAALDSVWRQTPGGCLSVAGGGRMLYEANAAHAVAPASAIKVLTASAALDTLGEDTALTTTVRSGTPDSAGRVAGDLWIVGGGDPLLGATAWARATERSDAFTSLEALADRAVSAGLKSIEGRVVGDESRYDSVRYVDSWPDRLIEDGEAGPLSALTVNGGFREWGHPGVPFENPPLAAAELFAELLAQRGVRIGGSAATGLAPPEASELASVVSGSVRDLVQRMLRESENGIAELLVKEIGLRSTGVGSTTAGVRGVVGSLARRGHPVSGSTVADGSGLSDADRVSCRLLTSVIATGSDDLIAGLPLAGRDGTLERRFIGTPASGRLRAKTGSLDGVAALTGTVQTEAGTVLSFAYIVNRLPHHDSGRRLQDALAVALASTS